MVQENPRHLRFMTEEQARRVRLSARTSRTMRRRREQAQEAVREAIDRDAPAAELGEVVDRAAEVRLSESAPILRGEIDELLAIIDHLIDKLETEADRREVIEQRHMALGGDTRRRE